MDETAPQGPHETLDAADQSIESSAPVNPNVTGDPDVDMALELITATFPTEAAAKAAYDELREAEKQEIVLLVDAAVVTRDHNNKLRIQEEHDMKAGPGALLGGAIGTIIGMIAGPLGLLIGGAAGAAIGAVAAEGHDAGLFDNRLKEFANALKPDSSMVMVAVAHYWSEMAAAFLTRAGGQVQTILLTGDIARQLDPAQ